MTPFLIEDVPQTVRLEKKDSETNDALAGAEFALYKESELGKGDWQEVSRKTTDNSGALSYSPITVGSYKLVETKAPEGYFLPSVFGLSNEYPFSIYDTTETKTIVAENRKAGTPVDLVVQKQDTLTNDSFGSDDPDGLKLAGAEFSIRYYDQQYDSVEDAEQSGEPSRVWNVKTLAGGKAYLNDKCLIPGSSPLYKGPNGRAMIPSGTVLIHETKAPNAYMLPDTKLVDIQNIKLDSETKTFTSFNPYVVKEQPRVAAVLKTNAITKGAVAGAEFALYKESEAGKGDWQEIARKTTDSKGMLAYSPVEQGSYKFVETKAPEGYMMPSESGVLPEHNFIIDNETEIKTVQATNYKKKDIQIEKIDKETNAPVGDTEFTVYSFPVTIDDGKLATDTTSVKANDPLWKEITRVVTDESGKAKFEELPYGYYMLKETRPNPNYASYEESGGKDRYVKLDKFSTDEAQVFEDMVVQVAIEVYKKTIAVTSSGLDGSKEKADNNVGNEEYVYHFGARSNSNVWVDEFIITDDLAYVTSKGYRMTTLWTGTSPVKMDYDNKMALLYKTNKTDENEQVTFSYNPLSKNPYNPNNPEQNMTFSNQPGWRIWQEELSTTNQTKLMVSDLELAEEEYIVGLKAVYGGVDKDFFSGVGWIEEDDPHTVKPKTEAAKTEVAKTPKLEHWSYSVVATDGLLPKDEMGDETVMQGSVTADLARNNGVLKDEDEDAVETRVIEPFSYPTTSNGIVGDPDISDGEPLASDPYRRKIAYSGLPKTGDNYVALIVLAALVLGGAGLLLAVRKSRKREK